MNARISGPPPATQPSVANGKRSCMNGCARASRNKAHLVSGKQPYGSRRTSALSDSASATSQLCKRFASAFKHSMNA